MVLEAQYNFSKAPEALNLLLKIKGFVLKAPNNFSEAQRIIQWLSTCDLGPKSVLRERKHIFKAQKIIWKRIHLFCNNFSWISSKFEKTSITQTLKAIVTTTVVATLATIVAVTVPIEQKPLAQQLTQPGSHTLFWLFVFHT